MDNPSSSPMWRGLPAGVNVGCVILRRRTSDQHYDRHRTTKTEHLPASRVEVQCAVPVAVHPPVPSAHRDLLLCPGLRCCGWRWAAPGSCWRRVPVLAARGLPVKGVLAVPPPRPRVPRHLRAHPPGRSPGDGAGSRLGQCLGLVVRPPRSDPARRPARGVCRGDRPLAGQRQRPGHRR
jgi:hypothetical protein